VSPEASYNQEEVSLSRFLQGLEPPMRMAGALAEAVKTIKY